MTRPLTFVFVALASFCLAQEDTRKSWDTAFREQRFKAAKMARPGTKQPAEVVPFPEGRGAQSASTKGGEPFELLGITIWRLRQSTALDDRVARLLVQDAGTGSSVEWTPERVEVGTPFSEGDHLRLSIEAPLLGYLYVVDREEYAQGEPGDPMLIFPTTRLRGGENSVFPGRLIDIPAQMDNPPYLTLRRTRPDHTGELLYVLITSEPLADITTGPLPVRLTKEKLAAWEARWGRAAQHMEMPQGAGRPWTRAERAAAADTRDLRIESLLTKDAVLPQTIYKVPVAPGNPIVVKVPLRIWN
jgi:hypothetical protein